MHAFIDRHGRARFYLRRKGHKKVPLSGLPWTPHFMKVYEAATPLIGTDTFLVTSFGKPFTANGFGTCTKRIQNVSCKDASAHQCQQCYQHFPKPKLV